MKLYEGKLVVEGKLSSGHARAVLAVQQPDKRLAAAKTMMESGMSVRQAEVIMYHTACPG